jgi:hypothetical protein
MPVPPFLPVPSFGNAIRLVWSWRLAAEPAALWPLLSDTNKLNVLAGLGPVDFAEFKAPDGRVRRVGTGRQMGRDVRWDEHPFEWSAPACFGVTRVFHEGPLAAYRCSWVLGPTHGGTQLVQTIELVPRSALWRPLVGWVATRAKAGWEAAYRSIEAYVREEAADPFAIRNGQNRGNAFSAIARKLEARGYETAAVQRLVDLVETGNAVELQFMRPFELAARWGESRMQTLELCLAASADGLLQRQWSHLCPDCRGPKGTVDSLELLKLEANCTSCDQTFEGRFDASIELTFRPQAALRPVSRVTYCVGGPGATPHIVFQGALNPGERRELVLGVVPGLYRVRTQGNAQRAEILYLGDVAEKLPAVELCFEVAQTFPTVAQAAGPGLAFALRNAGPLTLQVVVEQSLWNEDAATAALVAAMPAFQELCGEAPADGRAFVMDMLAFLAIKPGEHSDLARQAIKNHAGSLFREAQEFMLAAFYDPLDAVEAAVSLREAGLAAGIGLDVGECTAVRLEGRLVFQGGPVERALALLQNAGAEETLLSKSLANDSAAKIVLAGRANVRAVEDSVTF